MKAKKSIILGLFFIAAASFIYGNQAENNTQRFGIFIGSNNGGRERVTLRYAQTDARSMYNVFSDMGGITAGNSVFLVEPNIREVNRRIDAMYRQVLQARGNNRRTEIIFYYSGHSDEEGLLLNREKYFYRELRNRINNIPSDMRIVILDSCASGAFTRLKGGDKTLPFLMDSSTTAEGYAFLTSSSANEASQESDRIAASYFTHSLVAGLRGAADSVGDGRVTLNELYRFAYTETLARTETSLHGAQHPSYDIQISGSGDLVLTDINQTSAVLSLDENLTGRISIRNSKDHLIVELTKTARTLELGLEPGEYRITLQVGSDVLRADVTLKEGKRTVVKMDNFTRIGTETTRKRGDDETSSNPNSHLYTFFFNIVYEPFYPPLFGFINIGIGDHKNFQAGFVNWNTGNFSGFQAGFINTVHKNFSGFQAGYINTVAGNFSGFQAGFVNTSIKDMKGPQFGFVNVATQNIKGAQFGFFNYADSIDGLPVGFISVVRKGGYMAIEYSFSEFHIYNSAFKIGIEKFYTSILFSYDHKDEFSWDNFATGFGFGTIIPVIGKFLYINPEINSLFRIDDKTGNNINISSFVSYLGINLGKLSIAAGPSVTWLFSGNIFVEDAEENLPVPNFSFYSYDINEYNRIVVGGRIAARLRF
jgi:hypothetical protein